MTGADPDSESRARRSRAIGRAAALLALVLPVLAWGLCPPDALPAEDGQESWAGSNPEPELGSDPASSSSADRATAAGHTASATTWPAKFRMASQLCRPALSVASAISERPPVREAAQLALYAEPVRDAPSLPADSITPGRSHPAAGPSPSRLSSRPAGAYAVRVRASAPALARAARDFGIDPLLLHAVAHIESRHNPAAQSSAGARGLMQVMPATARRFGVQQPHHELLDTETNVRVSAEYLKLLQARFGNNLPLVLAAYNAGEGAVEKYGRKVPPYRETQAYVRMVIDTYLQLRAAAQRALPAPPAGGVAP